MMTLGIDIETYSPVDLAKCGVYKYAKHPDFRILLFGYSWNGGPVTVLEIDEDGEVDLPDDVFDALTDPDVLKTAHNAAFERVCLSTFYGIDMPVEQWECSMVKCAMLGLPLALGQVAKVLRLPEQKMAAGKALIRYFCMPCKPTKTNGGRTRNFPQHDPGKWELFKTYNGLDVEVEQAERKKVAFFEIPDKEKELYCLDQRINDRGVMIDVPFVLNAIRMDQACKTRLSAEATDITGLDNPNSAAQLKAWLSEQMGEPVESLTKTAIPDLIKASTSDELTKVLQIRQEMAKTSVKKYVAMMDSVGSDNRIRGLSQFYGASKTGRWSGRMVQMQNLPQNHLPDLDLARQLVRANDLDMLEMLFGNVPDTLSQLIRTAFVAKPGHVFAVADFSAIEARVIAWLADERWRLDVFATHGKIYEASASQMFKVPIEEVTKGSPLRQKGKVAELACIAEGQLVLTDKGLVPIQHVSAEHLLWDGAQFVSHKGLIFKGLKNVITYEGLTATPDHIVWIEGEPEPVRFEYAASCGAHLLHSAISRTDIWTRTDNISREKVEKRMAGSPRFNRVPNLPCKTVDIAVKSHKRYIKRVSAMLTTSHYTPVAGSEINISKTKMRKSERWKLSQLRSKRNTVQISVCYGSRVVHYAEVWSARPNSGTGPYRLQWPLRKRQYPIYNPKGEPGEQANNSSAGMASGRMAIRSISSNTKAVSRYVKNGNIGRSETSSHVEKKELAQHSCKVRVYDILSAGPYNRYTVSGVLVHNCGYGGGVGALTNMGAIKMGVPENELQGLIDTWRSANPNIVRLWGDFNRAAISVIEERQLVKLKHGIMFRNEHGLMTIELPSGRKLAYLRPRITQNRFGGKSIGYEGLDQTTKQWTLQETYGPKLVENAVQAIARDCLAESMLRLDKAGYPIVFHVHDEVILEVPEATADIKRVCEIMGQPISWAKGLLLRADGYLTKYYKKD